MLSLTSHSKKLPSRWLYCQTEPVTGFGPDLYRCWVIIIRHYWGSFTGLAEIESLTLSDEFRLTTGLDQAFHPIVRSGKSAVNQPDNPLAYYSIYILHPFWLSLSLLFNTAPIFCFCSCVYLYMLFILFKNNGPHARWFLGFKNVPLFFLFS